MLSPLAVFWYQILLSAICSCIHVQVWFYFTWPHPFYIKDILHEINFTNLNNTCEARYFHMWDWVPSTHCTDSVTIKSSFTYHYVAYGIKRKHCKLATSTLICLFLSNLRVDDSEWLNNSYTHASRSLWILYIQRPEAVVPKCSEGAIKGLRVYKLLDSVMHVYNCFRLYL